MPSVFPSKAPEFHHEIEELVTGDEDALIWVPRGHAKSALASAAFPVWERAYDLEPFTLLLSHTDQQVMQLMRDVQDPIVNATGAFDRLHEAFPDRFNVRRINDHEVVFDDGGAIVASSAGASTRGMKRGGVRPGLIVIDDLENEKTVATPDQREKTWTWFTRTVRPMLRPGGKIVWVGTLLHEDASMPRAERSGAFRVLKRSAIIREPTNTALWKKYDETWSEAQARGEQGKAAARAFYHANKAAMDAGAEVLWPARFPYIDLYEKRREIGSFAFSTEYQNTPVASDNQIVRPDQIIDFHQEQVIEDGTAVTYCIGADGQTVKLADLQLYLAIDPAISQKSTADYFALSVLGAHANGSRWLLDLVHDRLSFEQQIQAILRTYVAWRAKAGDRIIAVGVESVMYQKALKQALDSAARAAGLSIPTREIVPINDKVLRLTRQQPLFEQGLVHVQKDKHGVVVDEVCGFTRDGKIMPTHDDAMDALVYALALAEEKGLAEAYDFFTFAG